MTYVCVAESVAVADEGGLFVLYQDLSIMLRSVRDG